MPPLSYLTLLDIGLIINLGLIAACLLIVIASAVSSLSSCLLLVFLKSSISSPNKLPFHQFLRVKERESQALRLEQVIFERES